MALGRAGVARGRAGVSGCLGVGRVEGPAAVEFEFGTLSARSRRMRWSGADGVTKFVLVVSVAASDTRSKNEGLGVFLPLRVVAGPDETAS